MLMLFHVGKDNETRREGRFGCGCGLAISPESYYSLGMCIQSIRITLNIVPLLHSDYIRKAFLPRNRPLGLGTAYRL